MDERHDVARERVEIRETYKRYLKNTAGELSYEEFLEERYAVERVTFRDMLMDFRDLMSKFNRGLVR